MSRYGTFFATPLAVGLTQAGTGRMQVFATFNVGGEQVVWMGNLPLPGEEQVFQGTDEALDALGIASIDYDINRVRELPVLKKRVKVTIKAPKEGDTRDQIFINDENAAPRFREAAEDAVAAAATAYKARRTGVPATDGAAGSGDAL